MMNSNGVLFSRLFIGFNTLWLATRLFFRHKKFVKALFLFLAITSVFISCTDLNEPSSKKVPWDTSFTISGIRFPNDSIYSKSVITPASNWRIKQFIQKCKSQDSIKIGFIGGSITWGAWSSTPSLRYSSLFCSSLKKCFPNLRLVSEINAGVSATPSRFGCSRLKDDLLTKSPDLIVIEFAVNDFGQGDSTFLRSTMEGLVRQCLAANNEIPVILLFTSKGDGQNVQEIQSSIGAFYSLPMVSYRDAIWPLIETKKVPFNTFFFDDPHPNDNGHLVCAYLLYTYVKDEISKSEGSPISFPPFRYSDLYQFAGVLKSGDSTIEVRKTGWETVIGENGRIGFLSDKVDSNALIFHTSAREITFGIHMQTTDTSSIRIIVDNGLLDTTISNSYVFDYTKFIRLYTSNISTPHTLQVEPIGSRNFKIDYVLYAH